MVQNRENDSHDGFCFCDVFVCICVLRGSMHVYLQVYLTIYYNIYANHVVILLQLEVWRFFFIFI